MPADRSASCRKSTARCDRLAALSAPAKRPGGRSAKIRRTVLDAALDELVERGYEGLSLSSISRRAEVDRVTLYRRWGTVDAILADALGDVGPSSVGELPDTGSFRGDLRLLLETAAVALATPRTFAITRALNAATAPELSRIRSEVWTQRETVLGEIIGRAVDRGETQAPHFSLERLADILFGASQFRLVVRRADPHPADLDHYVELLSVLVLGEPVG